MLKETELRIISSFFPEGKEITIKKIMEKSSLSYEPVHRIVNSLADKNLVFSKKFGKTLVYSLNFEKEDVKTVFFIYAKERLKEFSKNQRAVFNGLLKINDEDIDFLAVFGSYAKGTQTKDSDVDVLCASSKKKENEGEIKSLKHMTNLDFVPILMSKAEFKKIKKENEVFWGDLVKFGIIFRGYELFYSEAYLK